MHPSALPKPEFVQPACPPHHFIHRFVRPGLVGRVVLAGVLAVASPAFAQTTGAATRWVSDELSTYVRSGPTDEYRIVGSLRSGQAVQLLQTRGNYSQVRSAGGEPVWVRSADLQETPSQLAEVPQLRQQVAELSAQLAQVEDTWKARVQGMEETLAARKTLIDELQTQREALNAELASTQSALREAQAQLGGERQELLLRYLAYGGAIAGGGLLAGLILPLLFRRRRRHDRWF